MTCTAENPAPRCARWSIDDSYSDNGWNLIWEHPDVNIQEVGDGIICQTFQYTCPHCGATMFWEN